MIQHLQTLCLSPSPILLVLCGAVDGKQLFEEICARDLEGIVAKRKLGVYKNDGNSWLKIKNKNYSRAEGRLEMLTGKVVE